MAGDLGLGDLDGSLGGVFGPALAARCGTCRSPHREAPLPLRSSAS